MFGSVCLGRGRHFYGEQVNVETTVLRAALPRGTPIVGLFANGALCGGWYHRDVSRMPHVCQMCLTIQASRSIQQTEEPGCVLSDDAWSQGRHTDMLALTSACVLPAGELGPMPCGEHGWRTSSKAPVLRAYSSVFSAIRFMPPEVPRRQAA